MRLIDADALLGVLNGLLLENVHEQEMIERIIKYAQTVEPQQWIPVSSGKLPKPVAESQKREWFITTNQYGGVTITCYEFESSPFEEGWQTDMTIVAWMPLPEPFREGGAEECH